MDLQQLEKEVRYQFSRSSGKGGQHVNKVSTRVELFFHLSDSEALSENEKTLLLKNLEGQLSKDDTLKVSCQESRSQHKNRKLAWEKLVQLLQQNLVEEKVRKASRPGKKAQAKRLEAKKRQSEKKALRKKPPIVL